MSIRGLDGCFSFTFSFNCFFFFFSARNQGLPNDLILGKKKKTGGLPLNYTSSPPGLVQMEGNLKEGQ